jgi:FhuF 2Fe-2S C-terminal domain
MGWEVFMGLDDFSGTSPIVFVFRALRALHPNWHVEMGHPDGRGWIAGSDLETSHAGPFHTLLAQMGERLQTSDRRTIAASFALRYGWSSGIAIAPYLLHQCVPKIGLDNVSFKFHENTAFERAALHQPEGVMLQQGGMTQHPSIQFLSSHQALLSYLRASLVQQAEPIVNALYDWSHFSIRGIWGMITSSWGSQFFNVLSEIDGQEHGLPAVRKFFEGNDLASQMQPDFYPVRYQHVTHVYHRRASCCRYYKLPQGQLCASCPVVSHEERIQRNQAWMQHLLERHEAPRGGG